MLGDKDSENFGKRVRRHYDRNKWITEKNGKKEILKGISLRLEPCTYGLVGSNGAGKTTLLRILAGVMNADGGDIHMENENGRTGYLPQKFGCFPEFTVYEQLEYFACLKKLLKAGQKEEILRVLEIVNMDDQEKKKCKKLSGGMVRRNTCFCPLFGFSTSGSALS